MFKVNDLSTKYWIRIDATDFRILLRLLPFNKLYVKKIKSILSNPFMYNLEFC